MSAPQTLKLPQTYNHGYVPIFNVNGIQIKLIKSNLNFYVAKIAGVITRSTEA